MADNFFLPEITEKQQTTASQFPVIPFKVFLHAWNVFACVIEKEKLVLTPVFCKKREKKKT